MVTLYSSPSCASCRKAKSWLVANNIPFEERNIMAEPLTIEEIKNILRLTEDGTEEVISQRSNAFQALDVDLDDIPIKELYQLIQENPSLIRRPIIMDDRRMQIGYNEDEIRRFIPRNVRVMELVRAIKEANLYSVEP